MCARAAALPCCCAQLARAAGDLAELRTLLDNAAAHLSEARQAGDALKDRIWLVKQTRPGENPLLPEKIGEELVSLGRERQAALIRAHASQDRIAMRIGFDTPIRRHYYGAAAALRGVWDIEPDDEENAERRKNLMAEHTQATNEFVMAARELIGTAKEIAEAHTDERRDGS